MASFFSSVRQGFGRQTNKSNNNNQAKGNGQNSPSPTSLATPLAQSIPEGPRSPALSSAMSLEGPSPSASQTSLPRRPAYFFREEYAGLVVKGNFMTLAAKPGLVEEGEWLAHQVVEQYRLLDLMIQLIRVVDDKAGQMICNPDTCPTMSASGHTYTWLDNQKRPIRIPACQYIQLVQKWIVGKISDPHLFPIDTSTSTSSSASTPGSSTPIAAGPTNLNAPLSQLVGREWLGKASGFPEEFEKDAKSIYRQMMRCYAHLYHGHWLDPFWNINAYKELNTCFIHFINVGRLFGLLGEKEMEPMQPLIDLWLAKGLLPAAHQSPKTEPASAAANVS